MISEEEKKAIKELKTLCDEVLGQDDCYRYDNYSASEKMAMVSIVLNLIETQNKMIDKLETKLMYALTPTNHELALDTQSNFKRIIRENIEEDTYTIRKKLKEYWENPDYWKK